MPPTFSFAWGISGSSESAAADWFCMPAQSEPSEGSSVSRSSEHSDEASTPTETKPSTVGGIPISALLSSIRGGDQEALGVLYDALFPTLWRIAAIRTRDRQVAEDAVHDVFLAFWTRRESLPQDLDVHVYLAAAVRNRTRNLVHHDHVVSAFERAAHQETGDTAVVASAIPLPDAIAERSEFVAIYHQALELLTERERVAVLLRWEEDFTFEQVAQVLGTTKMGARHIILRAQQKVQAQLRSYGQ